MNNTNKTKSEHWENRWVKEEFVTCCGETILDEIKSNLEMATRGWKRCEPTPPVSEDESNSFISTCCKAEVKYIGNCFVGYNECQKCHKRCKLFYPEHVSEDKTVEGKIEPINLGDVIKGVDRDDEPRVLFNSLESKINELVDVINSLREEK